MNRVFYTLFLLSLMIGGGAKIFDKLYVSSFVNSMNVLAHQLGMDETQFNNPTGLEEQQNVGSAKDMITLVNAASTYDEIKQYWNKDSLVVLVSRKPRRREFWRENKHCVINIYNTIFSSTLPYFINGHKTGSNDGSLFNILAVGEINDRNISLCVLGASSSQERTQILNNLVKGQIVSEFLGACVLYDNEMKTSIYAHNERTEFELMSLVKLMTCIVALENGLKEDDILLITKDDLSRGSGPELRSGDRITYGDAIALMLIPSSNTAANAIARNVGKKIFWHKMFNFLIGETCHV